MSWLLVILTCVLVAGGLGYYKYAEIQAAMARAQAFPEPSSAVEYFVVEEIQRSPSLAVSGEVVATRSADLLTELRGRIVAVGFQPGATVQKGQVLVQLDVSEEQANLAEALAEQKIARLALERAQRLVKSGAGSVEVRDQAVAKFESTGARAKALTAVIAKKTIRAPFAGIAGLHELEVGQFLNAEFVVTQIVGTDEHVWVDFFLPQEHAQIGVGAEVLVQHAAQEMAARVIARDASINTRSRNLRLRAELRKTNDESLLPGMLVNVIVTMEATRLATVVPATAVRRDAFGPAVYILQDVEEGGVTKTRARKRPIEIEQISDLDQSGDYVVVRSGLQPGEKIAAVGAFKLADGALVIAQPPDGEAQSRMVGH